MPLRDDSVLPMGNLTMSQKEAPRPGLDRNVPTPDGQALEELGIAFIAAHSPQAKGRLERTRNTLRGRP